jgi:hypothetical protein
MLRLLLQTRWRYYVNFLRCHFSRRLLIELGLLLLFGLYLAIRSPADIGFRIEPIFAEAYSPARVETWLGLLWLFYWLAEAAAFITLRPTADRDLLVGLPVSPKTFAGYYLLRFFLKISPILIFGSVPFLGGAKGWIFRCTAFCLVSGVLISLGLAAFAQAGQIRRRGFPGRWLLVESITLSLLGVAPQIFQQLPAINLQAGLLISLLPGGFLFRKILKNFSPDSDAGNSRQTGHWLPEKTLWRFISSKTLSCSVNDLYFLLRKKRGVFWILGLETFVVSASVLSQTEITAALISSVFIQVLFGWLFVLNSLMILFDRDARTFQIFRILPLSARQVWLGRWWLAALFCAVPLVLPLGIVFIKFPVTMQLPIFSGAILLLIPAALATIFCNTGFALFPQANLATYLMNFSILLVILFWFYMPFGSLFILGIMLVWIRKSQQHFQRVEIS